jgi:hypothetical protein
MLTKARVCIVNRILFLIQILFFTKLETFGLNLFSKAGGGHLVRIPSCNLTH